MVLRARCYEHDELPFAALDGLLAGLIAALRSSAITLDAGDKSDVSILFPGIIEDAPLPAPTADVAHTRRRAVEGLQRWLSLLASTRRILVVLDDVQWADRDSGGLMGEILSGHAEISLAAELASDAQGRSVLLERKGEAEFTAGLTGEAGASFHAALDGATASHHHRLELRASEAWLLAGRFDEGLGVLRTRLDVLGASYSRPGYRVGLSVLTGIAPLLIAGPEARLRAAPPRSDGLAAMYWTSAKVSLSWIRRVGLTTRYARSERPAKQATSLQRQRLLASSQQAYSSTSPFFGRSAADASPTRGK